MTSGQVKWVASVKMLARQKPMRVPKPPESGWRVGVFALVSSRTFDVLLTLVIVANIIVMAGDYWGIEQNARDIAIYDKAMDYFCYVYYVEATLKLTAFGVRGCAPCTRPPCHTVHRPALPGRGQPWTPECEALGRTPRFCSTTPPDVLQHLFPPPSPTPADFADNWCRFDFFLVISALLDQFATELLAAYLPIPPMMLRILRVFRVMRLFRLLKGEHAKGLRDLLVTM